MMEQSRREPLRRHIRERPDSNVHENETDWIIHPEPLQTGVLAREAGVSPLQARLLLHRGITGADEARRFLTPRLAELRNPMSFKDMESAVECVLRAARKRSPITVYGDYDADGLTAAALLVRFFSELGLPSFAYIPDRFKEGYGLNSRAVTEIAKARGGLLITVDCGTGSGEEIDLARRCGLDVVITDHHRVPGDFDPLCPFLNPHRPDCAFPFHGLAGVGVAFFLAVAVRAALRDEGWFRSRPEPDLRDYLDLVALGTVADMVPLLEENRILVNAGLQALRQSRWPGLIALQEEAGVHPGLATTEDVAFRLAPRINASGRLGEAYIGLEALITGQPGVARKRAARLHALNERRQTLEQDILREIETSLPEPEDLGGRRTLVLQGRGWHQGVLGIVASRLVARYHRPVLVLDVQDGIAAGSGRSIAGFDLHRALSDLKLRFKRFGGHRHAVGLSLETGHIDRLREDLESLAMERLTEADLRPVIEAEGELPPCDLTRELLQEIEVIGPFGSGNPEPRFLAEDVEVLESQVVGEGHLKVRVAHEGRRLNGIGFHLGEWHPLGGHRIRAVYTPQINRWQGVESLQLKIECLERLE